MLRKVYYACLAVLMTISYSAWAQPTNNPYLSYYPGTVASHWTEALKWSNIFNVTTYGAIPNDSQDDLAAVRQAIEAAYVSGGGVVFFPAGTYDFSDSLILKTGVILRGDNPSGVTDAKTAGYLPPSRLEFPQYIFDTTAFGGQGYPITTAFKTITNAPDARNIGVVNLDINRAGIEFHPIFDSLGMVTHPGGTTPNYQPRSTLRNVIVFGTRTNNVAYPDVRVPNNHSGPNQMRPWQRFYYNFVANIDVYASENVVIANNRINDAVTDNFDQPGYKVRNRCAGCTNYRNVGRPNDNTWNAANYIPVLDPEHARFDYTAHYGINLNRNKKIVVNGVRTIRPMIWYPEPYQEPSLYAKGFVIDDNWIYKTDRVGIWCAGLGLQVRRNVIRDTAINNSATWATPKKRWLNTTGIEVQRNFSATYENRGIDFGGSDITIEDNDVLVSAADFPESQYGSVDGEGIMDQGNGGGTNTNGLIIRNNRVASNRDDCTNPTIGVYRTAGANNILYENNEFTGNSRCLMMDAFRNGGIGTATNILVRNNRNVKSLLLRATGGGYNAVAHDNIATAAGGTLNISCFVREYNHTNFTRLNGTCQAVDPSAPDTTLFPAILMADPLTSVTLTAAPAIYTLKARITNGIPDSVVFFQDGITRLGRANIIGDTAYYDWMMPTVDAQYRITANAYRTVGNFSAIGKGNYATLIIDDGNALTNNPDDQTVAVPGAVAPAPRPVVFPNPARTSLAISGEGDIRSVQVTDLSGKVLFTRQNLEQRQLSVETLPAGTYLLRIEEGKQILFRRFVKE